MQLSRITAPRPLEPLIETRGQALVVHLPAEPVLVAVDVLRFGRVVRNLVGTLVYVGKGKHPPRWAKEVLDARDRARAAPTFAAEGLYLEHVEYEPQWDLPEKGANPLRIPVQS